MSRAAAAEMAARAQRLQYRLAGPVADADSGAPVAMWVLPSELGEISGLALTADGLLLAHGDEEARISVIDPRRGAILKRFAVGDALLRGDFEGITIANGAIYMLASNGILYEFAEGANDARVPYTTHDARLGSECEFEGVAFDARRGILLLPCKNLHNEALGGQLVIFRWSLRATDAARPSILSVPLSEAIGPNDWTSLHPSDITVDPATGDYVLVAAQERALIQISPTGRVVRSMSLPGRHQQAEGVAITSDGILIVSDEAANRSATITLYRWPFQASNPTAP